MFSNRILLMRPARYAPIAPQMRAFSLTRIALEPARKTAPPPPPPPPTKGRKAPAAPATKVTVKATATTTAKKPVATTTRKVAPVAAPVTRVRLTEKERAARDKAKEREKVANAREREKERDKVRKAKEREKEREKKEKEKLREAAKKEKEKAKATAAKMMEKPYPPPPRRPTTGFLMFATDPNSKRDRGEGVVDDATRAGQAWKALSEAEREVYTKKSEQARAVWKEEVAKWVSSLNLAQLTAARANREPGTRDESALSVLPKRPSNAYALFLTDMANREDFRNKIDALVKKEGITDEQGIARKKIGLYGRASADIWNSMSEKEKAVYTSKYTEAKKQWDKDFGNLIAAQKEEINASLP